MLMEALADLQADITGKEAELARHESRGVDGEAADLARRPPASLE